MPKKSTTRRSTSSSKSKRLKVSKQTLRDLSPKTPTALKGGVRRNDTYGQTCSCRTCTI